MVHWANLLTSLECVVVNSVGAVDCVDVEIAAAPEKGEPIPEDVTLEEVECFQLCLEARTKVRLPSKLSYLGPVKVMLLFPTFPGQNQSVEMDSRNFLQATMEVLSNYAFLLFLLALLHTLGGWARIQRKTRTIVDDTPNQSHNCYISPSSLADEDSSFCADQALKVKGDVSG